MKGVSKEPICQTGLDAGSGRGWLVLAFWQLFDYRPYAGITAGELLGSLVVARSLRSRLELALSGDRLGV